MGLVRWYSVVVRRQLLGVMVLEPLERSRSRSATAFDCSGQPGRSYKAIRRWLLPVLILAASRRDYTAYRCCPSCYPWISLANVKGTPRPEAACWLPIRLHS